MGTDKILIIIDNPTQFSMRQGTFLAGAERRLLDACLLANGIDLENVQFIYVVDKPTLGEKHVGSIVREAAHALLDKVNEIHPAKILALGTYAHAILVDEIQETGSNRLPTIKKIRGAMYTHVLRDGVQIPLISTIHPYMCLEDEGYWVRDFSKDIAKLAIQECRQPLPTIVMHLCDSAVQLKKALDRLSNFMLVSIDVETTGFHHIQDTIQAFGLGGITAKGTVAEVVILSRDLLHTKNASDLDKARDLIYDFIMGISYDGTIVMHNGKFDLKFISRWLRRQVYNPRIRDTMILNHLLDERPLNDATAPHGLKRIARERYDADDYKIDFEEFWATPDEQRDWKALHHYLALDLYYTARLYRDQVNELRREAPEAIRVYNQILCPASSALSIIESEGIPADPTTFKNLESNLQKELEQLRTAIEALVHDVTKDHSKPFNPQSAPQVNGFLYDVCKIPMIERKRTSGADALDKLLHTHRTKLNAKTVTFIDLIQDYRKLYKTVGTYAKPLAERAAMGVVYAQFNLAGTATGRLSSQDPNMQNIPNMAGTDIRRGFAAPENYIWIKADYSQLELRTAAELSRDPQMLKAFADDRDIHSEVASAMFGGLSDDPQVFKAQRFAAKFVDFGILYGRGAKGIAEGKELRTYNWSIRDAQRFIDNYLAQFSTLASWMREVQKRAIEDQELMTPLGRRRRWPIMSQEIKYRVEKQAVNFPVQSLASDITLHALVRIFEFLRAHSYLRARIVATVHDEIDLICHHEDLDEVVHAVLSIMTNDTPIELQVTLKAEADVGRNWADLTEYTPKIKFDFIKERLAF